MELESESLMAYTVVAVVKNRLLEEPSGYQLFAGSGPKFFQSSQANS